MIKQVVVLGAGGQVGLFAIERLLNSGCHVIAVKRDAPSGLGARIDRLRCIDRHELVENIEKSEDPGGRSLSLLSCGPVDLARRLLTGDVVTGVRWNRVVVTGTTSTITKTSSPDATERRTITEITKACDEIRVYCRQNDIPLSVLSPTLIYGCGMDQNLSRVYRWIQRYGFVPIASGANGLRQPLHVADLARTLASAVTIEPAVSVESPVCGSGTVTYEEMMASLFDTAGKIKRLVRLPDPLIPLAIAVSRLLSVTGDLNREMFRRQSRDLVFDDSPARQHLGHDPRSFDPTPADFCLPESIRSVQEALL